MRTVRKALTAVVAAGLLAACGGGNGDSGGTAETGARGKAAAETATPPAVPVNAPKGFDTSKGWQETMPWPPEDAQTPPVSAAPRAGVVAFIQEKDDDYVVEARDELTGALRWSGKRWRPLGALENEAPPLPNILVVDEDDREYVVLWAHGVEGEDALSKGREVVSLVLYPAGSSGKSVAPARTVTVPAPAGSRFSDVEVHDGGAGLLVRWNSLDRYATAVDVATGRFETYDEGQELRGATAST